MFKRGIYPGCNSDCFDCVFQPEGCAKLKMIIRKLINEGELRFDKIIKGRKSTEDIDVISISFTPTSLCAPARPIPLVITTPGLIPYTSDRAVGLRYGGDVYCQGVKQEIGSSEEKLLV